MNSYTNWNQTDKIDSTTNVVSSAGTNHGHPQFSHHTSTHQNLTSNKSYPRIQDMSTSSSNPNQLPQHQGQSSISSESSNSSTSSDPQTTSSTTKSSSSATTTAADSKRDQSPNNKKYNNRVISTTKRAEQNRNAQRAFRIRKEKYIKDLEEKAQEVEQLKTRIQNLEAKNRALTDYICELQRQMLHTTNKNDSSNPNAPRSNVEIVNANSISGGNIDIHNPSNVL